LTIRNHIPLLLLEVSINEKIDCQKSGNFIYFATGFNCIWLRSTSAYSGSSTCPSTSACSRTTFNSYTSTRSSSCADTGSSAITSANNGTG